MTDAATGKIKNDPKYIDWILITWRVEDGAYTKEHIGKMHPCTDEEYARFYPRAASAKKNYDYFKKEKAWMCADKVDN